VSDCLLFVWNGRQVSLREPDSNGSLDPTVGSSVLASLTSISSSYFNVEVPSALRLNFAGGVFAIAAVWPSRKVLILDHFHFGNFCAHLSFGLLLKTLKLVDCHDQYSRSY